MEAPNVERDIVNGGVAAGFDAVRDAFAAVVGAKPGHFAAQVAAYHRGRNPERENMIQPPDVGRKGVSRRTLVIGGAGAMGSHVVEQLLDAGRSDVWFLTRDPTSARSAAFVDEFRGRVHPRVGDVDDTSTLTAALADVDDVFCNTDFFSAGTPAREAEHAQNIIDAAQAVGVERFIWSSLDPAAFVTNGEVLVPHYDAKAFVEALIWLRWSDAALRKDSDDWYSRAVSVLTTAPYFENLAVFAPAVVAADDGTPTAVFRIPLGTDGRWPMIALRDIGRAATAIFDDWPRWAGRTLRVVTDGYTGDQIAATHQAATGIATRYEPLHLTEFAAQFPEFGHDLAAMFVFFQRRDLAALDRDHDLIAQVLPDRLSLLDWMRQHPLT